MMYTAPTTAHTRSTVNTQSPPFGSSGDAGHDASLARLWNTTADHCEFEQLEFEQLKFEQPEFKHLEFNQLEFGHAQFEQLAVLTLVTWSL